MKRFVKLALFMSLFTATTFVTTHLVFAAKDESRKRADELFEKKNYKQAAEAYARQLSGTSAARKARRPEVVDPNVAQLLDLLRDRLQTKVRVSGTGGRGKIEIEFYGAAELDRISEAILERP